MRVKLVITTILVNVLITSLIPLHSANEIPLYYPSAERKTTDSFCIDSRPLKNGELLQKMNLDRNVNFWQLQFYLFTISSFFTKAQT